MCSQYRLDSLVDVWSEPALQHTQESRREELREGNRDTRHCSAPQADPLRSVRPGRGHLDPDDEEDPEPSDSDEGELW